MKIKSSFTERFMTQSGKVGWALLWLLGVPLPVLLAVYFLKGCH
jgi:hypothetical protein